MFILEQGLRWDVIKSVLTDHPLVFTLSGAIHNLTYRMGYGSSLKAVCQSLYDVYFFVCGLVSCYHLFDISSFYYPPFNTTAPTPVYCPPLLFQMFLGHKF